MQNQSRRQFERAGARARYAEQADIGPLPSPGAPMTVGERALDGAVTLAHLVEQHGDHITAGQRDQLAAILRHTAARMEGAS